VTSDADVGVISGVSVAHGAATVDEIAAAGGDPRAVVRDLLAREGVREAFAMKTCNRAEAYVVADEAAAGRAALSEFAPAVRDGAIDRLDHEASVRHLMRVAAGLESLVLGEDQIIGQFRRAVEDARGEGGIGPVFDDVLTKAIHVGERARTETGINDGVVSLGSAAVELAGEGTTLAGATALVIGAGKMGTLAARALDAAEVGRLVVANRTLPHAEHVVADAVVDGRAIPLSEVATAAADADVIVTATSSPDPVLDREAFRGAGRTVVVDLAQPRDVDPAVGAVEGVTVHDLDDLEAVTDETRAQRRDEAAAVESIIDEAVDRLMDALKRKRADDAIGVMYESAERVKRRELDTAISRLESQGELTDEQRETVASLADALVGQLLAAPTKSLREAAAEDDWGTIQTAMRLFDPEFTAPPASAGGPPVPDALADADVDPDEVPDGVLDRLSDD
jgi:glutamyl-tRNA reductase